MNLEAHLGESEGPALMAECGDFFTGDAVNTETANYSCMLLEWVRNWSSNTRSATLLQQLINRKGIVIFLSVYEIYNSGIYFSGAVTM